MIPMTRIPGLPDKADLVPGMAHYSGSGPFGMTCGDCISFGYYRRSNAKKKHCGCSKYRDLMRQNGPAIRSDCRACKYFQQKPKP